MFTLDVVLMWGTFLDIMPTKQPLILIAACFIYIFMLLMLYVLVFTALLMG